MQRAVLISLAALVLGGCASHVPEDYNGTWLNQNAIDAAAKGVSLRKALAGNGPIFEWKIDMNRHQASYSNGFEVAEGRLEADDASWRVVFENGQTEHLDLDGDELVQASRDQAPRLDFERAATPAAAEAPVGASFEKALYAAYLGGEWQIVEGPGKGAQVRFHDDGKVEGLPQLDRYALCLAGDCTALSGEYDSLWLERNQQGGPWIFKRDGDELEIFQALNSAPADQMPNLTPGPRRWLLERD